MARTSIVMSDNAKEVWKTELGNEDYLNYPLKYFTKYDFSAPFASGSAKYNLMIVAPCSMGRLEGSRMVLVTTLLHAPLMLF